MGKALGLAACLLAALALAGSAGAAPKKPWLWQCEGIGLDQAKDACYIRLLLQDIDRSGNPATELPKIDARVASDPTELFERCHLLMHTVGRMWAREHHLTLDELQKVEPESNNPNCSAGFGMGLVMALGPKIISTGGKSVIPTCNELPTRWRQFTCIHSLGHALMRGYHETLFLAVHACARLGRQYAQDCAQGAFHDYWISLRGGDDATSPLHAVRSPRKLCAQWPHYALACWYRYWIEQAPGPVIEKPSDLVRLCKGLAGEQLAGCIAGASKDVFDTPVGQMRDCAALDAFDARACVRGVANQEDAGHPKRERALVARCLTFPAAARGACAAWFGQTFMVTENGRFACGRVVASLRAACAVGAKRWRGPLVTFS
ncbi:MAG TPA: hypothetical protein VFA30_08570 [Gaiellaceae bacterium]|nr:hypothetical protein [Gaiellaceae bacterium]